MNGSLPTRLRAGARALRHADPPPRDLEVEGTILAELESGPSRVLRVIYKDGTDRTPPRLSIRLWQDIGDGRFAPSRDVGIEILYWRMPAVAEAMARALELMEAHVSLHREGDGRRR